MSFIQDLQGITILPSVALRNKRKLFKKDPKQWPRGYAFGGWVYDANVTLGFSKQPTTITLSIVLENDSSINSQQAFDISDEMLLVSLTTNKGSNTARNFHEEKRMGHFYSIDLHGIKFNRMYLYDYSIQVEAQQKTLAVTFRDYSLMMGKIYVGLMKRQGPHRQENEDICEDDSPSKKYIRETRASAKLTTFCPNCYLMGDGFNRGSENPALKKGYGSNLSGFFNKQTGTIYRDCSLASFIGRVEPTDTSRFQFIDNLVKEEDTDAYKEAEACFKATKKSYVAVTLGFGTPLWPSGSKSELNAACPASQFPGVDLGVFPVSNIVHWDHRFNLSTIFAIQSNTLKFTWANRFSPKDYWGDLDEKQAKGHNDLGTGFTIDGGFMMLGTEEFEEKLCGNAPNVSYNFTELLNSLRKAGVPIVNHDGSQGSHLRIENQDVVDANGEQTFDGNGDPITQKVKIANPAWPDKNPRYRQNYIGTLREVMEQWCAVFSLDFYYKDRDSEQAGFYFLDLKVGADITAIRDVVDPTTTLGKEFGATSDQKSVILSYKESSTLENTYIQGVITSNIKPFSVKERKKSVKRYVPIMPFHPLDFASPEWYDAPFETMLGETFNYHQLANFIPYHPEPWTFPDNFSHRKRIRSRTNREIWDMDISIALSRLGQEYRDLYVGNRLCEVALSEVAPVETYPPGHSREGLPKQYLQDAQGHAILGSPATDAQIKDQSIQCVSSRWNHNPAAPYSPGSRPDAREEQDFDAQCAALGFDQLVEISHHTVKENIIDLFLAKAEIEDISMDPSHYKMFLGYYDETIHKQHVAWEQSCAEAMYGFGAIFGGTIPAGPEFVPRDYHGVMDGNLGFSKCQEGVSIPKLSNSFEPNVAQYPIYNIEMGQRPRVALESMNAPFNNILIESGNYLPTGLYIAQLDNPWGFTKDHFEKRFWEKFQDNACTEFNDSLNMIQEAGFNREPVLDAQGRQVILPNGKPHTKKATAQEELPQKTQSWSLNMFTPKFFTDTEKIFEAADGLIMSLHNKGVIVDEVTVPRWSVDYGTQRFCKKISVMVITDTRGIGPLADGTFKTRHPNVMFNAVPQVPHFPAGVNYMARHQRELWEISEYKRHQKDDIRNRCDRDLLYEFCEDAIQNHQGTDFAPRAGWGQISKSKCAIDPTGVYKEGWARDLIGGYPIPDANGHITPNSPTHKGRINSRIVELQIVRNPNNPLWLPTSELGSYHIQDLEEELEPLSQKELYYPIVYPVNNFEIQAENGTIFDPWTLVANNKTAPPFQLYSGIWTANVTIEDRRPELVEIYGHPPMISENSAAGIRVINNAIDPDLGQFIDPDAGGFVTHMYDNEGNVVNKISEYHNYIADGDIAGKGTNGLNHYNVLVPTKKIELQLAGSLMDFPNFAGQVDPKYGLQNLTISLSDAGAKTSLSFSDRPAKAPQQEAILNKIGPRTM